MVTRAGRVWAFRTTIAGARSVSIVGDFNDWDRHVSVMDRVSPDLWLGLVELQAGEYRFRYLADGHCWLTDYAAFGVERNALGGWDSVLYVPDAPAPMRPPATVEACTTDRAIRRLPRRLKTPVSRMKPAMMKPLHT